MRVHRRLEAFGLNGVYGVLELCNNIKNELPIPLHSTQPIYLLGQRILKTSKGHFFGGAGFNN
jgi:hypothetical protein